MEGKITGSLVAKIMGALVPWITGGNKLVDCANAAATAQ
jgi:hypothetical protein